MTSTLDEAADLAAIDAVITEMYAMISGPAGPRDWRRQANCFHPQARQIRTAIGADGLPELTIMGLDDYAANTAPFFAAHDFYEIEIGRRVELFGAIAHAWSAYEARDTRDADAAPERRGINSIQLAKDADKGWRIIAMIWDNEREGVAIGAF
ncbi:MAG TPA: hypothetical protein VFS87_03250 [Qipengyuania sp.]|nr:hypothetical protein [Qipengyuania sp.]